MLVSVVIPVYNCAPFIQQTLESVTRQTHSDLEILVCDDCSTDSGIEIARHLSDSRIRILESEKNQGQAHQLNKGITIARGEYIAIMHGDDLCYPDRIKEQIAYMETNRSVDICGCLIDFAGDWEKYKYPGGVYQYSSDDDLLKLNLLEGVPFAHPAAFLRKSLADSGRFIYNQEYVPAEDWELWVRIAPHVHFGNVEQPLVTYRIHDRQISITAAEKYESCVQHIRQQYFMLLYDFSLEEAVVLEQLFYNKALEVTSERLALVYSFLEKSGQSIKGKDQGYAIQKKFLNETLVSKVEKSPWHIASDFARNKNVRKALGVRSVAGMLKRKFRKKTV